MLLLFLQYHKDLTRLISGDMRARLAQTIVEFANQWMKFVTTKCEKGKGVKPRWAKPGFDFLCVACEPRVTAFISNEEFIELKKNMNTCILYVIGDRGVHPHTPLSRPGTPLSERMHRTLSYPQGPQAGGLSRSTSRNSWNSGSSGDPSTPLSAHSEPSTYPWSII